MGRPQTEDTRELIRQRVIERHKARGTYTGLSIRRDKSCKACGDVFRPSSIRQNYCSINCRPVSDPIERRAKDLKLVLERRKTLKQKAVAELGGQCELCGYNKYVGALDFHHRNPSEKDFSISFGTKSWAKIKEEVQKCALLCSNCHREVHAGIILLPNSTVVVQSLDKR